ncbi:hypothetical protein [Halopiger xanaduensis]|uniref:Uncharacterized protein n=1 Tax=Halopiger xanaduensis (strain DSM 18323 / JCM 14033 / SH-6) TaxID=797210 RepID=F8D4M3_HALXS|nr:hypothetical protein [Halopiger xanaduensis]AEH36351.1 hypothetical protein Halxa_1722 [Halopiger xanaduensis SH-6]
MLLELLLEAGFDAVLERRNDRTGPQWAALFLGVLLLLAALAVGASSGLWYGLTVAVFGIALVAYGF